MTFARVAVLFGALAMFMTMQGCGGSNDKEKDDATKNSAPAPPPAARVASPKPLANFGLEGNLGLDGPDGINGGLSKHIHHLHKAVDVGTAAAHDYLNSIPDEPPSPKRRSPSALDIPPMPEKRPYHETLSSAPHLRSPPLSATFHSKIRQTEPKIRQAEVMPKRVSPVRTASYTARKEKRVANDGSHYTSVQITAPAGANMHSAVTDRGGGDVTATQTNYNIAAEDATTAVQSGPPHQEHDVDVVKAWS